LAEDLRRDMKSFDLERKKEAERAVKERNCKEEGKFLEERKRKIENVKSS